MKCFVVDGIATGHLRRHANLFLSWIKLLALFSPMRRWKTNFVQRDSCTVTVFLNERVALANVSRRYAATETTTSFDRFEPIAANYPPFTISDGRSLTLNSSMERFCEIEVIAKNSCEDADLDNCGGETDCERYCDRNRRWHHRYRRCHLSATDLGTGARAHSHSKNRYR